ncbi:MAG: hypothetical protein ACE5GC_00835 [Acidimicrobiia bacterium]
MPPKAASPSPPPGNPVTRFLWQSGGLVAGRAASLLGLFLIFGDLGQERYGRFVVLLALLELAVAPWKMTPWQSAAAGLGRGASHGSWIVTMATWWAVGTLVLGPIIWVFAGPDATVVFAVTSAANGWMTEHIPGHLLAGRQRKIALGMVGSQLARLGFIGGAMALGLLTPTVAILIHGLGYLVGVVLLWTPRTRGDGRLGPMLPEVGTEALTWVEVHGPVIVVAVLLGLSTAGGFDLLYRVAAAVAELIGGVGLILLPNLIAGTKPGPVVARGLRLPTAGAALLGIAFALAAAPVLEAALDVDLEFGLAPALLAVTMVLAPWMGVTKATLLTHGGVRWILPSQIATSGATMAASAAASHGIVWAAAAIALGHVAGAAVRWWGMRAVDALPVASDVFSARRLTSDVAQLPGLLRGGKPEGDQPAAEGSPGHP